VAEGSGNGPLRELLQQFGQAAVGAVTLTADRADRLAEELSRQGGMRKEDARAIIEEATARWRSEAIRLGERASSALEGLWDELGLVTQERFEELDLRLAQLEHRLRLLEGEPAPLSHGSGQSTSGDGEPSPTGTDPAS
jgi:polyhydroxyalkanoate synthesis regulator phasin